MSTQSTHFIHLNKDWNADPNAPASKLIVDGTDLILKFFINHFVFEEFNENDVGYIRFHNCTRYKFTQVNDEGWYMGQCRFSLLAPSWGEFYHVKGDFKEQEQNHPWTFLEKNEGDQNNYLFYFRDETFECSAKRYSFDLNSKNMLRNKEIEFD
ncbi:hypothetical protein [Kiloniella antarctica]|uniref:Uncharacterized protein n=1 Tax=Kiloniella antarctica TaxID=1550907 RepID=A0ABW5BLU5_9PROT